MTYGIRVVVRSGVPTLTTEGELPEGEHYIGGAGDRGQSHIEVVRRDAEGRYVTHAQHTSHHQE